jgi:hypothetical protein
MVKGETVMPIPGGEITSTESWGLAPAPVEEAVEAVEEELPEEEDQA